MINKSFTVGYYLNRVHHTILGVTSIVPNMNGFLFFTEDGKNHFVESHSMQDNSLTHVFFEYSNDEDIQIEFDSAKDNPTGYIVHDHRNK